MDNNSTQNDRPPTVATASPNKTPWARWTAIAVVLFGTAARCRQFFGCPSYWYDEAYLLLNVFERPYRDLLGAIDYHLVIPPAFLWLSRFVYTTLGGGEWSMRLPAFAAGMTAMFLMIPLARRYVGSWAWICPVLLLAVSKHAVVHACEVRPYSTDLLLVEALLVAIYFSSTSELHSRRGFWGFTGLLMGAVMGPWLSFPSVFVLGGASAVLLVAAIRDRRSLIWLRWLGFNAALLVSVVALWYFDARHLYYGGLREHWEGWQGFPPDRSFFATAAWCLDRLPETAEYATSGMGWPLALLAVCGCVALCRRSLGLAMALTVPLALALVAALIRRYPIADRTVFFAAPCVWLLAAAGLADLMRRVPDRWRWTRLAAVAILLAPCLARTARSLATVESKCGYREAFQYVHEHCQPGDSLWVLHPEVYQAYFGKDRRPMGYDTPADLVEQTARAGRLWTVTIPENPTVVLFPELFQRLRSDAYRLLDKHPVDGLDVDLYVPARRETMASQSPPLPR